jgi:hypothetical protein
MSQSRKRDVYISAKGKKMILTSVLFIPLSLFFFFVAPKNWKERKNEEVERWTSSN